MDWGIAWRALLSQAVVVGILESFGSFWSSSYKETIVFSLLMIDIE